MWRNSCTFPQQYAGAVIVCTPNCWRVVTHKQQQLISNHSNSSSNNTYSCNQAVIITTVLSRFIIIFQSPLKQWLYRPQPQQMNIVFSMSMASMQDFFPSRNNILCLHSTNNNQVISDFIQDEIKLSHLILDNNVNPSWQSCILWLDRGVEVSRTGEDWSSMEWIWSNWINLNTFFQDLTNSWANHFSPAHRICSDGQLILQ